MIRGVKSDVHLDAFDPLALRQDLEPAVRNVRCIVKLLWFGITSLSKV
jgi:hypothetical protein